jgi:hypothetical protein
MRQTSGLRIAPVIRLNRPKIIQEVERAAKEIEAEERCLPGHRLHIPSENRQVGGNPRCNHDPTITVEIVHPQVAQVRS